MEITENEDPGMAAQVGKNKKEASARARGETVEAEELPQGASKVEASAETPVAEEESPETPTAEVLSEEPPPAESSAEPEEEPIRIAGKVFKTQKEAFEYAEKLEQEKLIADAHALGVREALAAQQPPQVQKEEEEDFEAKFYSNPKETLKEIQARARDEAVDIIRRESAREKAWNEFLTDYPDIRRQDAEAVLSANTQTIGKLPWADGRKALAQAVYREYDEISNLRKPKTELPNKKPAVSPSGGASRGVTPRTTEEKPLSFSEQLRKLKK